MAGSANLRGRTPRGFLNPWETGRQLPLAPSVGNTPMTEQRYLDFDLLIEGPGAEYTLKVLAGGAFQAEGRFRLPFTTPDLELFVLKVGRRRSGLRRVDEPDMKAAKDFGARLFEAVFADEIALCFRDRLATARQQGAGVRIRLQFHRCPELANIPWEYLHNQQLNRFFCLSQLTPIVRYLSVSEDVRALAVAPPLRVLVMISKPQGVEALDVEREWSKLHEAVQDLESRGLLAFERLANATLAELQRRLRLRQYHVFHFIGHGGFDSRSDEGILVLEEPDGRPRQVGAQHLGMLLRDEDTLRLAVLNACEGGRPSDTDPFAGTAQCLVQQGVPAVIAMQFEVSDEAAIAFAHELYRALADGSPVDAAVSAARQSVFNEVGGLEWGTPVLYMRAPDGRIFDVAAASEPAAQAAQTEALYRDALAALAVESWPQAISMLESLLVRDPAHAEAAARLRGAREGLELSTRYAVAREHGQARRWREAREQLLGIQRVRRDYKDVTALLAMADNELRQVQGEADRQGQIATLVEGGESALARQDWAAAVEKLQSALRLDPSNARAASGLRQARQQECWTLISRGRQHYERERWGEALAEWRRARELGSDYEGLSGLIAAAEQALARPPRRKGLSLRFSILGCSGVLAVSAAAVLVSLIPAMRSAPPLGGYGASPSLPGPEATPAEPSTAPWSFTPPTVPIHLRYAGDYFGCVLNLVVDVGGRRFNPNTNPFRMDVPAGAARYTINGSVMCPTIGFCRAAGAGDIQVQAGATYDLAWLNTAPAFCQVTLAPAPY